MARLPPRVHGWEVVNPALPKFDPSGQHLATVVSPHHAVLDIGVGQEDQGLGQLVCALVDALGPQLDREACSALTGARHLLIPGDGDAAAQACVVRLPALPAADFRDHWLHRHAPLATSVSGACGYQQLHSDGSATRVLNARLGFGGPDFDGIGRLLFPTTPAMYAARATDEVRAVATADEMRFIDHTRSQVTALRRIGPTRP